MSIKERTNNSNTGKEDEERQQTGSGIEARSTVCVCVFLLRDRFNLFILEHLPIFLCRVSLSLSTLLVASTDVVLDLVCCCPVLTINENY